MKKVISILVSVMMILAAIPAFADTAATAPASVDVYENFSDVNVNADNHYRKENPFISSNGVMAPIENTTLSNNLDVSFSSDADFGNYASVKYFGDTSVNPDGGIQITDNNLNFTQNGNEIITFSSRIRGGNDTQTKGNLYLYLIGTDESHTTIMKWWRSGHHRLYWGGSTEYKYTLENSVWYDITVTLDFSKNEYILYIDGGKFDNCSHKANLFKPSSNKTYIGLGWGFCDNGTIAGDGFDIAEMALSTGGSTAYDEKLTFENGNFAESSNASWSNGSWSAAGVSSITRTKTSVGTHESAMKLSQSSANTMTIVNTIPAGTVGSDGKLIVEASYYEHLFGQLRITVAGVDAGGSAKSLSVLGYSSASWSYSFCGATAKDMPKAEDEWRRVRVVLDLENDKTTMNTWREANINDTSKQTVDEDLSALAGFADITSVTFMVWPRWAPDRYMCIDDFRVYVADSLRCTESNVVRYITDAVSVTTEPTLFFNMPIKSTTATTSNVTLTDSEGNAVAGNVGLSAQRNGISFYPTSDLNPEETYTLTANCAVTDEFNNTLNVAKTITFTTMPLLTLVDFEFSSDEVVAGELGATIEVKAKDKLPKNIYAALAIYNKSTGELVSINTGSINAVTNTFNLSAEVPEAGEYYAKAFVWNTDANAVPYFTAQSIGLN